MHLKFVIHFWPKYFFSFLISFPSVERRLPVHFIAMSAAVISTEYKRRSSLGKIRRLPTGYLVRRPGFYFLGSWVCDAMATMTGCWADVTWCWEDSVPPSSCIFGRLAWGSPGSSAKISALGCLLTRTGGELEAWAAKIWRGLLRPGRKIRRKIKVSWIASLFNVHWSLINVLVFERKFDFLLSIIIRSFMENQHRCAEAPQQTLVVCSNCTLRLLMQVYPFKRLTHY